MRYVFMVLGVLVGVFGLLAALLANNSIHQIHAGVMLLTAAVLVSGAGVMFAVERLRQDVLASRPRASE